MKKNIWMVLAAASLMTACDYNEKYFEGFDETDQSNVQKYTVEYTEKTFKETESAKDVNILLHCICRKPLKSKKCRYWSKILNVMS